MTAALFLSALTGGGSRVTVLADQFVVTDGTDSVNPFIIENGVAYLQGVVATSLAVKSATSGERTEITNSLVKIYDAAGVERVRMGVW